MKDMFKNVWVFAGMYAILAGNRGGRGVTDSKNTLDDSDKCLLIYRFII